VSTGDISMCSGDISSIGQPSGTLSMHPLASSAAAIAEARSILSSREAHVAVASSCHQEVAEGFHRSQCLTISLSFPEVREGMVLSNLVPVLANQLPCGCLQDSRALIPGYRSIVPVWNLHAADCAGAIQPGLV